MAGKEGELRPAWMVREAGAALASEAGLELSVVVPVRDEADNIAPLIDEIRASLDGVLVYEIVCVDDGSKDATPDRLDEARATCPGLRVIRHRECCGQSAAIRTGVEAARAPWIATLDGDGQNDPADIRALWSMPGRDSSPDSLLLIVGHRRHRRDGRVKRLSSRVANWVRAGLLGDKTPDTGCGLKLFSRAAFLSLPNFDHMHRFLPALFGLRGGQVMSVAVNHRPRFRGRSHYGVHDRLWVGIVDLIGVKWLQRRTKVPVIERED